MTKIPPLPEPPKAYTDRGSEISFGYTADHMDAHALATWNAAIEAAAKACEERMTLEPLPTVQQYNEARRCASAIRSMKEPQ